MMLCGPDTLIWSDRVSWLGNMDFRIYRKLVGCLSGAYNREELAEANVQISASAGEKNIPRYHFVQNIFVRHIEILGGQYV